MKVFNNAIMILFLTCIFIIALFSFISLVTESRHLFYFSVKHNYDDSSLNYNIKACKAVELDQQGQGSIKDDDWKRVIAYLRCALLSSPDVQVVVDELGEVAAINSRNESTISALGTMIALITLVFTIATWFIINEYSHLKESFKLKESEINNKLEDLDIRIGIQKLINSAKGEIVEVLIKHYGYKPNNAIETANFPKMGLDCLSIGDYQNAVRLISPLFCSLDRKHFPKFIELLALYRQLHEESGEYFEEDLYFGERELN